MIFFQKKIQKKFFDFFQKTTISRFLKIFCAFGNGEAGRKIYAPVAYFLSHINVHTCQNEPYDMCAFGNDRNCTLAAHGSKRAPLCPTFSDFLRVSPSFSEFLRVSPTLSVQRSLGACGRRPVREVSVKIL